MSRPFQLTFQPHSWLIREPLGPLHVFGALELLKGLAMSFFNDLSFILSLELFVLQLLLQVIESFHFVESLSELGKCILVLLR
jgi:hypothetical protein